MTPHNACEPFEVGRCADWMFLRPIPRHCHWHPWTDPGANKHSVTSCRVQGNVRHIPLHLPAMQTSSWQRHSEQQGKPLQACLQNPGLGAHSRSRPKQIDCWRAWARYLPRRLCLTPCQDRGTGHGQKRCKQRNNLRKIPRRTWNHKIWHEEWPTSTCVSRSTKTDPIASKRTPLTLVSWKLALLEGPFLSLCSPSSSHIFQALLPEAGLPSRASHPPSCPLLPAMMKNPKGQRHGAPTVGPTEVVPEQSGIANHLL